MSKYYAIFLRLSLVFVVIYEFELISFVILAHDWAHVRI